MNTFYQLKITLKDIDPVVWRRFVVPSNITLDRLHDVVQIVMGWQDYHLHQFMFKKQIFTEHPESINDEDESVIRLNTLLKRSGNKLTYLYDFGDSWEHEIVLEDKNFSLDEMQPIECIEGIMACPPEDCGGAHAYMHLLRAVFDPQNNEEDYEAFLEIIDLDENIQVSDVQSLIFQYDINAINLLLNIYLRWSRDRALPLTDEFE